MNHRVRTVSLSVPWSRGFRVVVLLLIILGTISGCGKPVDRPIVITFPASAVGRVAELLRKQLDRFENEHPDIRIELRRTPDASEIQESPGFPTGCRIQSGNIGNVYGGYVASQWDSNSYQLSVISYQLSVISYQLSVEGDFPSGRFAIAPSVCSHSREGFSVRFCVALGLCFSAMPASAQDETAGAETFFETNIRPVLAAKCFKCHGTQKATNGLRVDSRKTLIEGGKHGPAVVGGDPEGSLLIRAVRYQDERKMPPNERLSAEVVADLERWIAQGAIWPDAAIAKDAPDAGEHWAFRPVRSVKIPVPNREDAGAPIGPSPGSSGCASVWASGPVDFFVFAKLQEHGLNPSESADKPTLLRRATFDLIGLPPMPAEVDAFLADESPTAFAKVVDRLLASPLYGQRWGRHWLDLVRYTDDFDESWRYRDWVVNAFNADLPYDQFVRQQIAGDLLPTSEPGGVHADAIVATTVLSIGPWTGIDRKKRLTDIADDQIDIVSRSFLGLTIACARCHDHKFDPITTADYYGLAGIFLSSRVIPDEGYLSHGTTRLRIPLVGEAEVERHRQHQARVQELEQCVQAEVEQHYAEFARSLLPQIARYLLAAWDYQHRPADQAPLSIDEFTTRESLHAFALNQWIAYLKAPALGEFLPLNVPERDFDGEPGVLAWRVRAERPWWAVNTNAQEVPIETFCLPPRTLSINPGTEGGAVGWKSPLTGTVKITGKLTDADPLDGVGVVWAIDHVRNRARHELSSGTCVNGTVKLEEGRTPQRLAAVEVQPGDEIFLQVRLRQGDAHYDITNVELVITALDGTATWDLTRDVLDSFLVGNPHGDSLGNRAVWHFDDMAGSRRLERMPAVDPLLERWRTASAKTAVADRHELEDTAREVQQALEGAGPHKALVDDLTGSRSPFWVRARDDAKYLSAESQAALAQLTAQLEALKHSLPPLPCAHGVLEGGLRHGLYPGLQDAPIHIRGSYDQLGTRVPRHFPAVLVKGDQPLICSGSGRMELARWLGSVDNPLTARVLVNRLWQHHFGEGIVRTPSNFGALGERPTHPEMLDFLSARFVESGWSIKAMHWLMMLSSTYQQSSRAGAQSLKADPENRLLGRMNRQRLEAEAIHDALLAVAGRLDARPGGPAETNPMSSRRMLYIKATRSNRSGLGPLFDAADAAMHVERRTVSTVAPQALYLMNDPWIADAARQLTERPDIAAETDPPRRIQAMYKLVFGRRPTPTEVELGCGFVERAKLEPLQREPGSSESGEPWVVYTQALLLSNEFMFFD